MSNMAKSFHCNIKYCPPIYPKNKIQFLNLKTARAYSQKQTQNHLELGATLITVPVLFSLVPPDIKIRFFFFFSFLAARGRFFEILISRENRYHNFVQNRILNIDEEICKKLVRLIVGINECWKVEQLDRLRRQRTCNQLEHVTAWCCCVRFRVQIHEPRYNFAFVEHSKNKL